MEIPTRISKPIIAALKISWENGMLELDHQWKTYDELILTGWEPSDASHMDLAAGGSPSSPLSTCHVATFAGCPLVFFAFCFFSYPLFIRNHAGALSASSR